MSTNPITRKKYQAQKSSRAKVHPLRPPRKKRLQMKKYKVPASNRYCLTCRKKRSFKLVPLIGHSRCTSCGGSYSAREDPNKNRRVWVKTDKGIVEEKELKKGERGNGK